MLEVETYRVQAAAAVGRTVERVVAPDAWYVKADGPDVVAAAVTGRTLQAARRRGKLLVLDLDDGGRLGLRFGMTGRLLVDGAAAIDRLEYSSGRNDPAWDRFGLVFTDGSELRMRDPRRLGGVEIDPDEGRLGPDAAAMTLAQLDAALGRSQAPLKARLLDQARIAGIGNLLADEMLWRAGVSPVRPAGSLDREDVKALHAAVGETLAVLGERGGSHTGDLREAAGLDHLCPKDGAGLVRRTVGGRTTLSCPTCQPDP
jgi:formamidopyrimidine-DNA glycosylase